MSSKPPIIGIDLGTTNSLVAVLQGGRPVVLSNTLGERLTPSAVSVGDAKEMIVGAAARARLTTHPELTATAFKREMGTDRELRLGNRSFTPQELSALVLTTLKQDAEAALGVSIEEAVITVPAYFGDLQRQATRDAGTLAGLKVERILNEPTAAAMAYGLHHLDRELRIAVLDLGGGTFDVTLLEIIEGVIEIQSSAGDARLGGEDFDTALAELLARRFREQHGLELNEDRQAWVRLRHAAENAKHRLSEAERTEVLIPALHLRGETFELAETLTRAEVEAEWAPLLERIRSPIQRALRDASLSVANIDEVLLVGGSTRMPCVVGLAAQLFGRLPLRNLPPDEAIAMGAAVQAALKEGNQAVEDLVVTDVAPFSLGVATSAQFGRRRVNGMFSPILERGTVIPTSRVERFSTASDFQQEIHLEIFQGEHAECAYNTKLGDYWVKGLAPAPSGHQGLDVRFSYDLNGVLEVEMTLVSTGKTESFVLERRPGSLTPEQIEASRRRLAGLKLHPRDALPNTTALARADAAYVELTGQSREVLGEAIARMRAALETQNAAVISGERERLIALVASLRS